MPPMKQNPAGPSSPADDAGAGIPSSHTAPASGRTPEDVDQMRRDMEAGTPGPWEFANSESPCGQEWYGCGVTAPGYTEFLWLEHLAEVDIPLARRIARVPQLEAEVLRLRSLIGQAEYQMRSESDPVKRRWADWLSDARAALKGTKP